MSTLKRTKTIHSLIKNVEGIEFLKSVAVKSVDLVLTDPPYLTSRKTGMDALAKSVAAGEGGKNDEQWCVYKAGKSEAEWHELIVKHGGADAMVAFETNYKKYGNIYGKKYAVHTDYGDWDRDFTLEQLDGFVKEYYRVLRDGGVAIVFFDTWKLETLKNMMVAAGFKQIRLIVWEKTNPQPLNSSRNLLTNALETAVLGVKKGKPTFNSKYDTGVMRYPIAGGKNRFHATQKNLDLFKELVRKFSNEGDLVLDTFLGSGTTAVAAKALKRSFIGCEMSKEYYDKLVARVNAI